MHFMSLCCSDRLTIRDIGERECYLVPFSVGALQYNKLKFDELLYLNDSVSRHFKAFDRNDAFDSSLLKDLFLCVGAQIIFLKKIILGRQNSTQTQSVKKGSLGKIVQIISEDSILVQLYDTPEHLYILKKFIDELHISGSLVWSRKQYPVKQAFCLTVRDALDLNLNSAILDLDSIEENGREETLRLVRGLVYSAFGSVSGVDSVRAIKGLLHDGQLLKNKIAPSDEARYYDKLASENCEIMKENMAAFLRQQPEQPRAANMPAEPPVTFEGFTQLMEMMKETLETTKQLANNSGGGIRTMNNNDHGSTNNRAVYTGFAAGSWARIPTAVDRNVSLIGEADFDYGSLSADSPVVRERVQRAPNVSHRVKLLASSDDDYGVFDQPEIISSSEDETPEVNRVENRPMIPPTIKCRRRFEDPTAVEIITPETYEGKAEAEVCPYNPNNGGNWSIQNENLKIWSDRPFLKIYNVNSRDDLERKVRLYLGPLPTSCETWSWSFDEKLKVAASGGTGRKMYCSFGGRALTKQKRKKAILLLISSTSFLSGHAKVSGESCCKG